ncbi:hypothetical protein KW791_01700 [Candidatus Parcubacteria bacterium]|nr:hypothetical protein [Candidatus Parcubacteria bacterium]
MSKVNLNNKRQKEQGSIIVFTVLILGSILSIVLTLGAIFVPKIRGVADAGANSVTAIYTADSASEWCIYTNRGKPAVAQPVMSNGGAYTISGNCTLLPLNYQIVGTYRNVSRSLLLQETP